MQPSRRRGFLKSSLATAAWAALRPTRARAQEKTEPPPGPPRIRFAAIGLNHGHIYGQVEAVRRGGGELVAFFAKEPDLAAAFTKRYPASPWRRAKTRSSRTSPSSSW